MPRFAFSAGLTDHDRQGDESMARIGRLLSLITGAILTASCGTEFQPGQLLPVDDTPGTGQAGPPATGGDGGGASGQPGGGGGGRPDDGNGTGGPY
jgi:hypothetical protein